MGHHSKKSGKDRHLSQRFRQKVFKIYRLTIPPREPIPSVPASRLSNRHGRSSFNSTRLFLILEPPHVCRICPILSVSLSRTVDLLVVDRVRYCRQEFYFPRGNKSLYLQTLSLRDGKSYAPLLLPDRGTVPDV